MFTFLILRFPKAIALGNARNGASLGFVSTVVDIPSTPNGVMVSRKTYEIRWNLINLVALFLSDRRSCEAGACLYRKKPHKL